LSDNIDKGNIDINFFQQFNKSSVLLVQFHVSKSLGIRDKLGGGAHTSVCPSLPNSALTRQYFLCHSLARSPHDFPAGHRVASIVRELRHLEASQVHHMQSHSLR
jgi:hypothetical protein